MKRRQKHIDFLNIIFGPLQEAPSTDVQRNLHLPPFLKRQTKTHINIFRGFGSKRRGAKRASLATNCLVYVLVPALFDSVFDSVGFSLSSLAKQLQGSLSDALRSFRGKAHIEPCRRPMMSQLEAMDRPLTQQSPKCHPNPPMSDM